MRPGTLIFKVIFITSLILIVSISFIVWMDMRLHEASIKRLTYEKTKIISEFIERNVIRTMEKGRHFDVSTILNNFATYKGIFKIHIFNTGGLIKTSSNEREIGQDVGNVKFFLENQYFIREEMVGSKHGKKEKERIYYFNNPILNKPECYQCHHQKEEIIGILTVANSLKEMDEEIFKAKKEAFILAVITIGSLSLLLGLMFQRFINLPIKKLTHTMRKAEEGDLNVRVDLGNKDEMGSLAENLNIMIQKLNFAKREAEQYHQELVQRANRMASIGELASGIAHEIRNPLAGIQGAIQILADEFPKEDRRRQVTDEIKKQINKMERLVKDLLNYAKPVPSNYFPIDINELVDKVLSFFMTQRGGSEDLKIEKKFFSPLPKAMIDPNSMEQAFLNIALNAQKAMVRRGTFTVSTRPMNRDGDGEEVQEVQIVFEDTGSGISKEDLPKVFNPFFSTRSDGTGLGLSITKNIVEQNGGRIEVESEVNIGTRFIITLPAMK